MIKNTAPDVKRLLKEGRNPILPFEREILRVELGQLGVQQKDLGRLLGEAMEQSSETWHDNAPADAINYQSILVVKRAEKLIGDLGSAVLLEYPERESSVVTLGSVVGIAYPGHSEIESLLLAGLCRTVPETKGEVALPGELEIVTARSPLGEAILGLVQGDHASYQAGGRNLAVEVASVQQFDPQSLA